MADRKLLKPVKDKDNFMLWRIAFEDGGQVPAEIAEQRFNDGMLAREYADKQNILRAKEQAAKVEKKETKKKEGK